MGLWDQFLNEEITLNEAARKREDLIPLSTRVVSVSFAQAYEMITPLQGILSRRGVLEVDTPALSPYAVSDVQIESFAIAESAVSRRPSTR